MGQASTRAQQSFACCKALQLQCVANCCVAQASRQWAPAQCLAPLPRRASARAACSRQRHLPRPQARRSRPPGELGARPSAPPLPGRRARSRSGLRAGPTAWCNADQVRGQNCWGGARPAAWWERRRRPAPRTAGPRMAAPAAVGTARQTAHWRSPTAARMRRRLATRARRRCTCRGSWSGCAARLQLGPGMHSVKQVAAVAWVQSGVGMRSAWTGQRLLGMCLAG